MLDTIAEHSPSIVRAASLWGDQLTLVSGARRQNGRDVEPLEIERFSAVEVRAPEPPPAR